MFLLLLLFPFFPSFFLSFFSCNASTIYPVSFLYVRRLPFISLYLPRKIPGSSHTLRKQNTCEKKTVSPPTHLLSAAEIPKPPKTRTLRDVSPWRASQRYGRRSAGRTWQMLLLRHSVSFTSMETLLHCVFVSVYGLVCLSFDFISLMVKSLGIAR